LSRAKEAMSDLGRHLELGELVFKPPEALTLNVLNVGRLSFEEVFADSLLVSLSWPLPPYDRETLPAALKICALESRHMRQLKASLHKDDVVLSVQLSDSEIAAPELQRTMIWLLFLRDKILGR
jgi:type III secretion system chaperone SycN